ncbi:Rieske 2Fe-2S domain-containing protein [Xylophilus sp.]|uniref:Rieske 2Fe-2S domain-containing protein n=1 Tax=Xylophilus sp. TaxID=2653893 RepID=UPI0013B80DA6|nr:Rieske 2Fe-2S domain-containing protein [Xylophilus sp.]KAF1044922.1 MAG: Phthalate 4,5-dioxygenase oxygenase subunit [Xylophilus sp.]
MAMTQDDNEDLCRVGPGTVMGELLRQYWHPVLHSDQLAADGAPIQVRLLGEDFVAFRASDGRVGFFHEKCPHRGASLVLARNEDNGLRCIYHAWKFDVEGRVVHLPTEQDHDAEAQARCVKLRRHPVREEGGLVWVYPGGRPVPAPFPAFDLLALPQERRYLRSGPVHCNWVQIMEAFHDSSHVEQLHRDTLFGPDARMTPLREARLRTRARTEFIDAPWGLREAAVRTLPDGTRSANIKAFVAPHHVLLPSEPGRPATLVTAVPIDDTHTRLFFLSGERRPRPIDPAEAFGGRVADPHDFRGDIGTPETAWGQDREAMRRGHANGLVGKSVIQEDVVVAESMGPIADRSYEHPTAVDAGIVRIRERLLAAARALRATGAVPPGLAGDTDYGRIRTLVTFLAPGENWGEINLHTRWEQVLQEHTPASTSPQRKPSA